MIPVSRFRPPFSLDIRYRDPAGELFDLLFVIGFHGLGAFYEQFFDIAVIDEFPFLECCPPP
jgi:hypothetical protein